mgnify:CR=1 FL=1|jgi:hypothetical protein
MGYDECRRMPVRYRRWFIEKLISDIKKKNQAREDNMITEDTGPTVNLMGSDKRSFK